MNVIQNDRKVGDNNVCEFYQNSWTDGAENWAKGWGLKEIRCMIAVQKKNPDDKDYILIDGNEIIYATKQYEALGVHIDIVALSRGLKRNK